MVTTCNVALLAILTTFLVYSVHAIHHLPADPCLCVDAYLDFWAKYHTGPPRLWLPKTQLQCRTFCYNQAALDAHNQRYAHGLTTYRVGVRPWHHLPGGVAEAREAHYLPPRGVPTTPRDRSHDRYATPDDLRPAAALHGTGVATQWDWYPQARVTNIRDQGMCGDCWAESAVAVLESWAAQAHGSNLTQLSVQQAAECTPQEMNFGCGGGWPRDVFEYVANNASYRLCTEASYPTVIGDGFDRRCNFTLISSGCNNVTVLFTKILSVAVDNDTALFEALQSDVVSVAIDASGFGFGSYEQGVYDGTFNGQPDCSTTEMDHAVVAIGWGLYHQNNTPYYLVRNSWGATSWGAMSGNILMLRGNNTCGIAHDAVFLR
jgi:hypothetical protein